LPSAKRSDKKKRTSPEILDRTFKPLLSQCLREQSCVSPGLFSISVELEGGKTLAKVIRVR
jgi:hypothetical protein